LLQYGLFVVTTLWLAKLVGRQNERLRLALLVGLLLNPFLISTVVDCFTEGFLASIVVLVIALTLNASRARRTIKATTTMVLSIDESAALRDRLLSDIAALLSHDNATSWDA
jgi:hypothetical protein